MKIHGRPRIMLLVLSGVIGLLVHGAVVYYVASRMFLSVAAVAGLIVLIVIKHLGMLGRLYALFRRRHPV